jgi:hypothetical protein
VDTTSFSVSGAYEPESAPEPPSTEDGADAVDGDFDTQVVAITYGYSRDSPGLSTSFLTIQVGCCHGR